MRAPARTPTLPRRRPTMVLWILRGCFVALLLGVGLYALDIYTKAEQFGTGILTLIGILVVGAIVIATDLKVRDKEITTISAVYFGLLLGLLLGTILANALDPFIGGWSVDDARKAVALTFAAKLVVTITCCYVVMSTLLQTKDEFRFIIPYVEFSKQIKGQK